MKELVFLLEERSAKAMLESLLPRLLNPSISFRCIPFEGKQDLEKQLIRKIRAYQNEKACFIVLRDQDASPDYAKVKAHLLDLCQKSAKADRCLVRIACHELESFYLADLEAVGHALELPGLAKHQLGKKFKNPDQLGNPSQELRNLTGHLYEKVAGSRAIGRHLRLDNQRSPSFRNLIQAIQRLEKMLLTAPA